MNRRALPLTALVAALASSFLFPFPLRAEDTAPATQSLYERLGGEPAITAVVADFVGRAAADPAVNFTRKGTAKEWNATPENIALLKKHLVQFISMAAGGPQKYEGKDMKTAHAGMGITDAEFDAAAADLKASLVTFNVPQKEQDELMGAVGSTRKDIVEYGASDKQPASY